LPTVSTAVIPAAGLGTRLLPYTKASPKEMLPIVDRPTIEYIVEEAVSAGIEDVLIVTSRGKQAIEDHFDRVPELEERLAEGGKSAELDEVRRITDLAHVHFIRQGLMLGLGHAVGVARHHVGDRSFAVLLGDDVIHPDTPLLSRMIDVHLRTGGHVVALMEVSPEETSAYGVARVSEGGDDLIRIEGLVEKPAAGEAPSNLAVIGRYVLGPDIFEAIDNTRPGQGGEIQLTDAIASFAPAGRVFGVRAPAASRFDVGKKSDYLRTIVEFALDRKDVGPDFGAFLDELVERRRSGR
jgi:UTP--glucose-1-phosphate uridylyltransferase